MKTIAKILTAFTLLFIILVVAAGYGYFRLTDWSQTRRAASGLTTIDYPKGTSLTSLAEKLTNHDLINNATAFRLFVRLQGAYTKFQAGSYQFDNSSSPQDIIEKISTGDTFALVIAEITIPEGFTIIQVRDRLVANGIGDKAKFNALFKNEKFISKLSIASSSLEGYLYPATYRFYGKKPTASEALEKMTSEFFKRLPKNYVKQVEQKGLSLDKAVSFASLIEKETLHEDEKPLISEVIWRRLNDGSPLGIDAGLIYGIKDYDGDIRWKDLKNKKNPYNSRIHTGLPPTAIGATSISSLKSVLNPANKRYYYYVRTPGSDNRHHFSKTLEEHNRYVKKWIKSRQ